jgi:hypothetical protein
MDAETYAALGRARAALIAAGFSADDPAVVNIDTQMSKAGDVKTKSWLEQIESLGLGLREKVRLVKQTDSNYRAENLVADLRNNFTVILDGLITQGAEL